MKKRHYTIPIFVPHIGCPNNCVFCNQNRITGAQSEVTADSAKKLIEEHLKYVDRDKSTVEIAFFGGSFTGIDFDKQTELLECAHEFVKNGSVDFLRCSTRPDFINQTILDNLKKYSVKTIELGVQSTDEEVLLRSERGHSRDDVFAAAHLIKANGFSLGLQMMPHLPGDTREKTLQTVRDIIKMAPDCVRIYPTLIVPDTALYDMYQKGEYTPADLDYTVDLCASAVEMFELNGIDVIRIGLQTTDNINEKTVIGPYHSALGELVYSEIYKRAIEKQITENDIHGDFVYYVRPGHVSKAVGQRKANIEYFKDKYGVNLKVCEDKTCL